MKKKTFKDIDATGKKIFVRVDFNVPQDETKCKGYSLLTPW